MRRVNDVRWVSYLRMDPDLFGECELRWFGHVRRGAYLFGGTNL